MTDVLQEACRKLGVDANQHGLKYKGKQLDLSLAFRLTGLSSGAKLELVQLSRSPSVVTVALQLPEQEARGAPNGRLVDKFPSTTTIWLLLRKFEAGVAGSTSTRNLTGRGVPANGETGRLLYETPVVQILDRELSAFDDLQKTLMQLGFNGGNILIRLSFRQTDEPLDVAMVKMQEYFQSSGDATPTTQAPSAPTETKAVDNDTSQTEQPSSSAPEPIAGLPAAAEQPSEPQTSDAPVPAESTEASAGSSRPVTVFSPPSNDTPQSAQTDYNDSDYIPSVDHAKAHQRRLNQAYQNKRLLSDAEIAAKASAEEERRAGIKEVDVKVRLPDQSQVVAKFGQEDTGKSLYDFVRNCLDQPFSQEKFHIAYLPTASSATNINRKIQNTVPDSDQSLLIKDLGMAGRVLVNFSWNDHTSPKARQSGGPLLKQELRTQAQTIKVEQPAEVMDTSEDTPESKPGPSRQGEKSGARKAGGLPKWLKLPGKK